MSTHRILIARRASRAGGSSPAPGAAPPARRRVVAAGLIAAAASLAADVTLASIGQAVFAVPGSFGKFSFVTYALLTVLGVAGATATWAAVTRLSSRPRWLLTRLAALVTALLLIPDFLMLMHLAIAVITFTALVKIAPARSTPG
jgi:hypothetical protein